MKLMNITEGPLPEAGDTVIVDTEKVGKVERALTLQGRHFVEVNFGSGKVRSPDQIERIELRLARRS